MTEATAVLTIAHGTVEDLDDLPTFLTAIRRGHAAPPDLVAEVRRRYEAIGGQSPLTAICRDVTRKLGERLGRRAVFAARLWDPKPEAAVADLARDGVRRVVVLPLAQHSAALYVDAVKAAARSRADQGDASIEVVGPGNWGQEPKLTKAFAAVLSRALDGVTDATHTRVLFTAHSLPLAVIRSGDPYEQEVRTSAASVAAAIGSRLPHHEVVFQSQGMSGGDWLGPDVKSTLGRLATEGVKHVVFAPIGFLADHVEVLYDLDIEARAWAEEHGMTYARMASLNASSGLIDALEVVARSLMS
jgi:ferrochelatase